MPTLAERLQADLKSAMLAKDEKRTSALRQIRAELLKKEKEAVGTVIDDDTVLAILGGMVKQRRDSIEQFQAAGRTDLVEKEQQELDIIATYLPATLSDDELRGEIEKVVAATGASSAKDLGRVMGPLLKGLKAAGKGFDGARVNALVKERLGA